MNENKIKNLIAAFKTIPLEEKIRVKKMGRPTPELNLHQEEKVGTRKFTRHFSMGIYKKNSWITGCDDINALFCFPCVLFYSDGMDKKWSVTGLQVLKHLNQKMKKHEVSASHLKCCTDLALLDSINTRAQLDSLYRHNIMKHNEQVTKNRYILKKIINCIKLCGKLELALRGHDEKEDSENRGILMELLYFSSDLDAILKEHLKKATVFKGTPKTVQNDILKSMLAVCRQEIKEQIDNSDFLAIQCDETTDVSNHCQMVMILRYYQNGNIYERFWNFLRVTDKSASGLTQCIENQLEKLISNSPSKLIAQTYDGANGGVQSIIKSKYTHAHFVHCYAHQLNSIVQKATSQNAKVNFFFSNLSAIPSFFSNPTHRCDVFEEVVERTLPGIAATRWNYNTHLVNDIYENREKLIECFEELEERCNKTITCKETYAIRRLLEDPDFFFFLELFHDVLPHVNILFNKFQAKSMHNISLEEHIEEFVINLTVIKNLICEVKQEVSCAENKRIKIDPKNNSIIAKEVLDALIFQMKDRLSYTAHLEAASLLEVNNFFSYCKKFPTTILKSVSEHYPMLQCDKLRSELEVIYSRSEFKQIIGGLNMLSWLSENGLNDTFSETVKLLKIIVTTPMDTAETERCFSTLKRIKTFLQNTMDEERLNVLAMMSINNNLVHAISNFDEKVIEHFISQKDLAINNIRFKKKSRTEVRWGTAGMHFEIKNSVWRICDCSPILIVTKSFIIKKMENVLTRVH